jgi:hypothetical protein
MGPQVIDPAFSRHLDLAFTVNTEKYEKHRALHLMNVSRHLSGSYMCKAESSKQKQSRSKKMWYFLMVLPHNGGSCNACTIKRSITLLCIP